MNRLLLPLVAVTILTSYLIWHTTWPRYATNSIRIRPLEVHIESVKHDTTYGFASVIGKNKLAIHKRVRETFENGDDTLGFYFEDSYLNITSLKVSKINNRVYVGFTKENFASDSQIFLTRDSSDHDLKEGARTSTGVYIVTEFEMDMEPPLLIGGGIQMPWGYPGQALFEDRYLIGLYWRKCYPNIANVIFDRINTEIVNDLTDDNFE